MSASIIAIAAEAITRDFARVYVPCGIGWLRRNADLSYDIVSDEHVMRDVQLWLEGLEEAEGGEQVAAMLRTAVNGNPGWAQVLASRVMRQLRGAPVTSA